MKKLLITLTAAGVLAMPVGAALAQDVDVPPDDSVTTVQPDRDRDRTRLHQEDGYAQCDGTGAQDRSRMHVEDQTGIGAELRPGHGHGDCDVDCTGDQARIHQAGVAGVGQHGPGLRSDRGNGRNG